jgi:hypothetical protein
MNTVQPLSSNFLLKSTLINVAMNYLNNLFNIFKHLDTGYHLKQFNQPYWTTIFC